MDLFVGLLGLAFAFGLAYLLSNDKTGINYKAIGVLILLQLLVTVIAFKTTVGLRAVEVISNGVTTVLDYGYEGVNFVVGGLMIEEGASVFFINVLMLIIFTSTLLAILTHIKVLPLAIKYIGGLLGKITGLSTVTTFNAINSIFFGQSEAVLAIKSHLDKMSANKLFIISTSAMASVSSSIMGAYMLLIPPQFVLVAMLLNALSALIITSFMTPITKEKDEHIDLKEMSNAGSIFQAISQGALDGGKVALIVAAMLVAYNGLIALVNGIFMNLIGIDFSTIIGYVFAPVAWLMGIPGHEVVAAGSVMATKLVTNEFVAMLQFQPMIPELSAKTVAIVSTFTVSFANFSSIGIISGSIQAVNGEKANQVAKFGLKMLLAATLSSIITATMTGFFF